MKQQIKKLFIALANIAITHAIVAFIISLVSCNVTRTITTSATTYQHGDTTTTITTKTIESYDATKR